jgi:transient receptor potential cation channel subfamily A protein 1
MSLSVITGKFKGETPCHVAANLGCLPILKLILDRYPSAAHVRDSKDHSPLYVSAASGNLDCLKLLLSWEVGYKSTCKKLKGKMLEAAAENGHAHIVKELLINKNKYVKNALIKAIEEGHSSVIETIINSNFIEDVLSEDNKKDDAKESPFPMEVLIRDYPKLAERVLDRCMKEEKEKWIINTKLLKKASEKTNDKDQCLSCNDSYNVMNNHPMMIMCKARHENLLKHPVSLFWTKNQWVSYGRTIFFMETILYLFYLLSLSVYSSTTLNKDYFLRAMNDSQNFTKEDLVSEGINLEVSWWFTVVTTVLSLLYELLQLTKMKFSYFCHFSNWVDMILYFTTILLLVSPNIDVKIMSCSSMQCWKWPTAAILLSGAWLNFLRYFKFFSFFGIFLIMFVQILKKVIKLSLMIGIFILAFSFSFHIILVDQDNFTTFGWAYLKTVVMSLGEFEYESIFRENNVAFHTVTVATFISLIMVMTLVLMNMLIGIAVDITKGQKDAEIEMVCSQIELVLELNMRILMVSSFLHNIVCCCRDKTSDSKNTKNKNIITVILKENSQELGCNLKKLQNGSGKLLNNVRQLIEIKHFMSTENIRKTFNENKNKKVLDIERLEETMSRFIKEMKDEIQSLKVSNQIDE